MKKVAVRILRIDKNQDIPLPRRMTRGASGMDLCAAEEETVTINPGEIKAIGTGLKIALPTGYEAQIRPRSGLALKQGVTVLNTPGTIDSDYRGEVKVILINLGRLPFKVNRGDRIAQMVIQKLPEVELLEVDELPASERDEGGFGHTG